MLDYKPNIVLSNQEFNVVGTRPIRQDGADKVTGRAQYGADIRLPGLLHGKLLRSPHAHARIKSIDASRALALPGVHAVVTSGELAKPSGVISEQSEGSVSNGRFMSNNILADDKVLYKGHAVAAVAADNPHVAEQALSLIYVEYEVLPMVLDAKEAMKKGAPLVHERLATQYNSPHVFATGLGFRAGGMRSDDDTEKSTNVSDRFEFRLGDLESGFESADVIVEKEVSTVAVHQGYIEPHSAMAMWHGDGNLTIWSSSQGHFGVRDTTALMLNIPISKVRAIPMEIGGGFGAKLTSYLEPVAALLAKKTGKPVKLTMSRTEVFEGTGPTSGTNIRVKLGATKDGKLVAAGTQLIFEAGAFPGSPVTGGAQMMLAAYDIPNAYIEGFDVVVNRPKTSAYRAPGTPAAAFAMETAIDELCEKLKMDPIEFRLLNSAKEGTRRATGQLMTLVGLVETLEAAKNHPHYTAPLEGPFRGRGVASGYWQNYSGPSNAMATVNADGTVNLVEGSPDIGGTRVSVSQQFADVLGIAVEDVMPQVADTASIGFTSPTGGSGVTFKTGWACYEAALDVKRQMIDRAAKIWEVSPDNVEYVDGVLQHTSDSELRMTFRQLAARQNATGGPIVGSAGVNPGAAGPALATHIVDVEVDPDTGKVDILRYTAVQDAGKAIHPSYVEGQMQGGAVQGIGWALNEEYFVNDQGQMLNSSFLDYRMPTTLDLPMIDTVIVEVANPGHPYGVRGVGEVPIVPPMAAIANAIHDAVGVRIDQLPMKPGRILEALWEKEGSNGVGG
jgi:xanthine dehydrogenase molybdenum-binding subunit